MRKRLNWTESSDTKSALKSCEWLVNWFRAVENEISKQKSQLGWKLCRKGLGGGFGRWFVLVDKIKCIQLMLKCLNQRPTKRPLSTTNLRMDHRKKSSTTRKRFGTELLLWAEWTRWNAGIIQLNWNASAAHKVNIFSTISQIQFRVGFEEISQEVQMKTKEKVESHCAHRISLNLCFSRDRKMSKPEQTIERFEELMKKKLMNSDVCKNQFWLLISSQDAKSWKQQTLLRMQPSHWFLKLWFVRFLIKLYYCDKSLMNIKRTTC